MIELNKVYNEDCRETMKRMPDNFVDSIVTDPPYELGFMGKKWDNSGIAYNVEMWKECLRVLKPGGYLLAFGGTRTSHRMVCAIEDAGFEIRDSILWLYGSGFPKSMNIGKEVDKLQGNERKVTGNYKHPDGGSRKLSRANNTGNCYQRDGREWEKELTKGNSEFEGWGTALKPAHEPICVARKPIEEKTVAANVLKYGTGGINIDGCRIEHNEPEILTNRIAPKSSGEKMGTFKENGKLASPCQSGRFPANIILDPFTADELDKQAPDAGACAPVKRGQKRDKGFVYGQYPPAGDDGDTFYDDKGGASRFFYIAKADQEERNAGLHQFKKSFDSSRPWCTEDSDRNRIATRLVSKSGQNFHPTVKPMKLIQYLQRLVTPKGGTTYDPFGGSGTSGCSAINEGLNYILSELILEHCDIADKRIYNKKGLF